MFECAVTIYSKTTCIVVSSSEQYSPVQSIVVHLCVVQCCAVQFSAVQYSVVQWSAVQCSVVQCSEVKCSSKYYSAVQRGDVKCRTWTGRKGR